MPRKRMISPELWSSEGFGALSTLAKVIYIGLISSADDEGRGRCKPSLLRSTLFPYDERLRTSDIDKALGEIEKHTSTVLYSADGQSYYFLRSWKKWQKIDKPSRSQIPPPPGEAAEEPEREYDIISESMKAKVEERKRNRTEQEQLAVEELRRKILGLEARTTIDRKNKI